MSWLDFIADRIAQMGLGAQIVLAMFTLGGLGYLVIWLAEWPDRRAARQEHKNTIIWSLLYLEALRKWSIDNHAETIEEEEVAVEWMDDMMKLSLKGIPRKKLEILIVNLIKNLREDKMHYRKVLSYYDDEFDNQEKMLSLAERLDIDLQDYNLSPEQIETLLEREENLRQQYSEFSE